MFSPFDFNWQYTIYEGTEDQEINNNEQSSSTNSVEDADLNSSQHEESDQQHQNSGGEFNNQAPREHVEVNNSSESNHHKKKNKVPLTEEQQQFKDNFFAFITDKKKLPKDIVIKIHKDFLMENIEGLIKMTRDESRSIDLYYINRFDYKKSPKKRFFFF